MTTKGRQRVRGGLLPSFCSLQEINLMQGLPHYDPVRPGIASSTSVMPAQIVWGAELRGWSVLAVVPRYSPSGQESMHFYRPGGYIQIRDDQQQQQ